MNKKWKFETDPITKGYIDYLDKSPIKFDNLKRNIELLKKMNEEVNEKTFIELCEEADIIKCYGRPAFFLNDTLYFSTQTLDGESRQEIKINRDKQPKRIGKYHWKFDNVTHIIQFFKQL